MFLIIKQPFLNRKYHFCNKGQFSSRNFTCFFVRKFVFRVSNSKISAEMINFEQKFRILNYFFDFGRKTTIYEPKISFNFTRFFFQILELRNWSTFNKTLNSKPFFDFGFRASEFRVPRDFFWLIIINPQVELSESEVRFEHSKDVNILTLRRKDII